jgi:hypothetical protein
MRIKPYDPRRPETKPRTAKQNEQFRLARVRGLWFHAYSLTGERQSAMQRVIDAELASHGQETQTARFQRQRAKLQARFQKEHP